MSRFGAKNEEERLAFVEEELLGDVQVLLQSALVRSGLGRKELAARMGVSEARISQILGAGANLTLQTVARFLDATGAAVRIELVPEKRQPKKLGLGRRAVERRTRARRVAG